jgi:hypothetical protein
MYQKFGEERGKIGKTSNGIRQCFGSAFNESVFLNFADSRSGSRTRFKDKKFEKKTSVEEYSCIFYITNGI